MKVKAVSEKRINAFKGRSEENWKIRLLNGIAKEKGKILDVGCASGYLSKALKGKEDYYGIDYDEDLVDFCNAKGLKAKQCDLSNEKIPFDSGFFDVVWCSHMVEHLSSREQINAFNEFYRVLKNGGKLLLFAPTPYHWYFWDDFTHVRPCTHGQLENLALNAGFSKSVGKYSKTRVFPEKLQKFLRLPPLRFFLWEAFLVAEK